MSASPEEEHHAGYDEEKDAGSCDGYADNGALRDSLRTVGCNGCCYSLNMSRVVICFVGCVCRPVAVNRRGDGDDGHGGKRDSAVVARRSQSRGRR